jgi:hypothetical protein
MLEASDVVRKGGDHAVEQRRHHRQGHHAERLGLPRDPRQRSHDDADVGLYHQDRGLRSSLKIGGALHGWFYGVQGTGGHALDEGRKVGPDVNSYSNFAGVFGTGVFVTGVAGTSIFGPAGVYGQMGEDPDASIPEKMVGAVIGASKEWPGVVGWSTQAHGVLPLRRTASAWRAGLSTASASLAVGS